MLCINIMESIRRKIVSLINSGSNKVCVVSLTKFYNFLKLYYCQIRIENKVGKKLPQLRTRCVIGVTRILITLFIFINWRNRNINGEIELANLEIQIA